jgi:hypothetical protein
MNKRLNQTYPPNPFMPYIKRQKTPPRQLNIRLTRPINVLGKDIVIDAEEDEIEEEVDEDRLGSERDGEVGHSTDMCRFERRGDEKPFLKVAGYC